ncbi:hypothetical protein OAQ99_04505 [Candidatus Kapabacteria bacterium]|nr:hypothetical protein [Candidatus Kapabacteria bacterium]
MDDKLTLAVKDFSRTPSGRLIEDEPNDKPMSGERWFQSHLKPNYEKASELGLKLNVDITGILAPSTGFWDESIARLSREFGIDNVFETIVIIADSEFDKDEIETFIKDPNNEGLQLESR